MSFNWCETVLFIFNKLKNTSLSLLEEDVENIIRLSRFYEAEIHKIPCTEFLGLEECDVRPDQLREFITEEEKTGCVYVNRQIEFILKGVLFIYDKTYSIEDVFEVLKAENLYYIKVGAMQPESKKIYEDVVKVA